VKHFTQQVEVCGVLDNDATLIILGAVSGRGRGSQFSSHCAGTTMEGLVELEKEHRTYTSDRNELVIEPRKKDPTPHLTILATQKNPATATAAHVVSNPFVRPPVTTSPAASFRFSEAVLPGEIHNFLFEIRKAGSVFWIGAAVPKGTTDFTRAQVFFHPTVVQNGNVIADDKDYREFKGGWSGSIQRYVAMEGGQLAAAGRLLPMLVPFTTMAAVRVGKNGAIPTANMFQDRPVETLNAVMAAIESEITGDASAKPKLTKVGAASFSSGIGALRLFLKSMKSSGLIKEVIDFDSPHIVAEPKSLTRSPGAVSRCFTQFAVARPETGWVTVNANHFASVSAFGQYPEPQRTHARIGWMMYFQAMTTSTIS
jgi:hypothetical protein